MADEIERKFLVVGDTWRDAVADSTEMVQGYLNDTGRASVRVRLAGESANLNIKAAVTGMRRAEYEYPIPVADARAMLETLCGGVVAKQRHRVRVGSHTWEIDVFAGENAPLVVAEIELTHEAEDFVRPDWLGAEVTDDVRYYNHALSIQPYATWRDRA